MEDEKILKIIQEWFLENCDGDWEHAQNFIITTIDNPGWGVTVNLLGTKLEEKHFSTINVNRGVNDWYYCIVKNHQFQGDGGPQNLIDILKTFINWIHE